MFKGFEEFKEFQVFQEFQVSRFTVIARRYDEATGFTVIARRYDEATGFTFQCFQGLMGLKGLMGLNGLKGLMGLDGFKVIAERDYEATGFMGSMLRVQGLRRSSVSVISGFTFQGIEGFQCFKGANGSPKSMSLE